MNSFKQALNQLKIHWLEALMLGCFSTAYVIAARFVPLISPLVLALGLVILQEYVSFFLRTGSWKKPVLLKKEAAALIITSLMLIPTSALLGSAVGLLEGPQALIYSISLATLLLIIAIYFYLLFTHAMRFRLETSTSIAKSLDIVALASLKQIKIYFVLSFYLSIVFAAAVFTYGAGFIFALPLLFFSSALSYQEIRPHLQAPQK